MSKLTYLGDLLEQTNLTSDLIEKPSSFLTSQHYSSDDVREVTKTPIDSEFRNFISDSILVSESNQININSFITHISSTVNFSLTFAGNSQLVIVKNDNNVEPNKSIKITITNSGDTVTIYPKSSVKIRISSGTISISKDELLDRSYPIGTYYWTVSNVDPKDIFGGTWVQVSDTFILAQGKTNQQFKTTSNVTQYFTYGATTTKAGVPDVTISTTTMPNHNHLILSHYHEWLQFWDNGGAQDVDQSDKYGSRFMQRSPGTGTLRTNFFDTAFDATGSSTYVQNNYNNDNPAAASSHSNMPNYVTTYCWRRTE